ncbi:LysR family transcriptional regulator [Streptomyces griseiscabiei]|uniref:LysR family transcriptional regulator n=1 Tax=Streptomyces griseiscabiei TaxID=2993540 RepID=A0ABU4LG61_9ACTN|nr:LysR family transcriptional regulator [Streptomyces griseiscabiei]MBZ3900410.1 LysR family transcriptional regulator [Streptomyces griseiscabiei]MDX2914578.1 LysR family transcriptional regulator [Streptomyces griseiscabiei]
MDITVQQLRYFVAVAEDLHFARAAQKLHVAAPSLSQQIAALERLLRAPLFRRTSRQVVLTDAGAQLLPLAKRALTSMADISTWAEERHVAGERLRIGLAISSPLSSAILAAAAAALPDVRLEVRHLGYAGSVQALTEGRIDAAIAPGFTHAVTAAGVRTVPLWSEDRVLVVAATHQLAARQTISIEETNEETFFGIEVEQTLWHDWFAVPRSGGLIPRVDTTLHTVDEILDVCAAGMGVTLVPSSCTGYWARPDLAYVPIDGLPDTTAYLLLPSGSRVGVLNAFEGIALQAARQQTRRFGARPATGEPAAG